MRGGNEPRRAGVARVPSKSDNSQQAQTACRRRHKTRGPGAKSGSGHSRERSQHSTCRTRAAAAPKGAWAGSRQGAHVSRPSRSPEGILPRTQRALRNPGRESCDESYNHLFRFSQTAPRGCGPARDRTLQVFPVVSRSPEVQPRRILHESGALVTNLIILYFIHRNRYNIYD